MDFGMPFLCETKTITDCAKLCSSLKLNFIELNMNFPQCQLDCLNADELNRMKEQNSLYFTIHLDENFNVCDFNREVRDAYLKTVVGVIALAKKIQAPTINMHLAKGICVTLPDKKTFLFEHFNDNYKANLLSFMKLCEREIGTSHIKIAIENTNGFMKHEKAVIETLLKSKCFGLTLDIGHSHAAGDMDISFFQEHCKKLIHMHVHDAKGLKNHLALGDGEIDLKQRLQLAKCVNARVVLETKTIKALTASVSRLMQYL